MLLQLLYSLLRFIVDVAMIRGRTEAKLRAEVLVLRHELRVLERQVGRALWQPVDRMILARACLMRSPAPLFGVLEVSGISSFRRPALKFPTGYGVRATLKAELDVPAIVIEKLSKRYGSIQALVGLDLTVNRGEVFGFLGPNGAGKSTTIRLLLGYLTPTDGRASILGLDTQRQHIEILRQVGYLPSYAVFEEVVTGVQALDDLAGVAGAAPTRRQEICERVGLDQATLNRKVRDYSKGTRRKLGVVQALQHDPEVIIMDEPTEGLDPLVQHSFYSLLEDLRLEGKTIFFSSHIISEVERVCDRVAIIRQGSLVTVEHISALVEKRQRHVEVRFDGPPADLTSIPGVTNVLVDRETVTCRFAGDVRPRLQHLATLRVRDLTIEQARLEDVFLEMYGEGDK